MRELLRAAEPISEPVYNSLLAFARSFEDVTTRVAATTRGEMQAIDIQPLRHACGEAARCLHKNRTDSEGARLMIQRLTEDLAALIRSMEKAWTDQQRRPG